MEQEPKFLYSFPDSVYKYMTLVKLIKFYQNDYEKWGKEHISYEALFTNNYEKAYI